MRESQRWRDREREKTSQVLWYLITSRRINISLVTGVGRQRMESCSRSDYLSVSGVFEHIKSSYVTTG